MINYAVEDVLAHAAPMILIDEIISYGDETIETSLSINQNTPFMFSGKVPSYVAVEYMAQSIAAYSGIQAREAGQDIRIGFLLGARKLELLCADFSIGDRLYIDAYSLYNDGEMASFNCVTRRGQETVAKARIDVYQPKDMSLITGTKADG